MALKIILLKPETIDIKSPSAGKNIKNITDKNNNVIWEELNFPTSTPTVFEVVGTTPITDPFGSVIAYNSVLKRSENQQIGQ